MGRSFSTFQLGFGVAAAALVALLTLPVLALFASTTFAELRSGLAHPLTWPALRLSLFTTVVSLSAIVALGTPLAWLLSRSSGRVARTLELFAQLPVVIPPAVAGVALLLAFGRRGVFGPVLESAGVQLSFTTAAVILAEIFVAAPFYVQAAIGAFRRLDQNLVDVARTLGARPAAVFFRVALPLSRRSLIAGAAMAWARALGEFGATLMFAGNLEGETQTLPLAIYTAMESDLSAARALSLVLIVAAFGLLLAFRFGAAQAATGEPQR